jgi:hypothetical protein
VIARGRCEGKAWEKGFYIKGSVNVEVGLLGIGRHGRSRDVPTFARLRLTVVSHDVIGMEGPNVHGNN